LILTKEKSLDFLKNAIMFILIIFNTWCLLLFGVSNYLEGVTDLEGQIIILWIFAYFISPIPCFLLYLIIRIFFLRKINSWRITLVVNIGLIPISTFLINYS